jgi:hypothetical protein
MPERQIAAETDDFHRAMTLKTSWPSTGVLIDLDSSVRRLAMCDREKLPEPLWKAFEHVNKRWPGFQLIRRLNGLVSRARKLLEEAGESDLTRLLREVRGSGQCVLEVMSFLLDLRSIEKDSKKAAKITWQKYEHFLFHASVKKRIQLACGDAPASPRVTCYSRALEIILDDHRRKPLRDEARSLLEWIANLGNVAYSDVLKSDEFAMWAAAVKTWRAAEENAERKRKQGRERQRRLRARKISR